MNRRVGEGPFWAEVTALITSAVNNEATQCDYLMPEGWRAIMQLVPRKKDEPKTDEESEGGSSGGDEKAKPEKKEGQPTMLLDLQSESYKGKAAKAMLRLLKADPEMMATQDVAADWLVKLVRDTARNIVLIKGKDRLNAMQTLANTASLSAEDREWLCEECDLAPQFGAVRIPCQRMVLGQNPNKNQKFSEYLEISFGGCKDPVWNLYFAMVMFKELYGALKERPNGVTPMTFDLRGLRDCSAARFWIEKLEINYVCSC